MQHDEPWQVFADNGEPVVGLAKQRDEFSDGFVMGAVHVWLWRRNGDSIEVLLQKRAMTKRTWPGFYDISFAGHIDADESPIDAVQREGKEELNVDIEIDALRFIFALRTPLAKNEIDHVYLYELNDDSAIRFADGEVDEVKWISLREFAERTQDAENANLVNQGRPYFVMLLSYFNAL
mgnify:CR=1 FL=1